MRKTLKDWKRDWIEENGETHELEVVVKDSKLDDLAPYIYEGSFVDIPEDLLDKKVIGCGQIIESSKLERNGAYLLTIGDCETGLVFDVQKRQTPDFVGDKQEK